MSWLLLIPAIATICVGQAVGNSAYVVPAKESKHRNGSSMVAIIRDPDLPHPLWIFLALFFVIALFRLGRVGPFFWIPEMFGSIGHIHHFV